MMRMSRSPALTASSTTYWMAGLSTRGSISLGWALVAGRKRVPNPAAGMTALRTAGFIGVRSSAAPHRRPPTRLCFLHPVAATLLGAVEGGVGGGDELGRRESMVGIGGGPDRDGHRDRGAARHEGFGGDDFADLGRQPHRARH